MQIYIVMITPLPCVSVLSAYPFCSNFFPTRVEGGVQGSQRRAQHQRHSLVWLRHHIVHSGSWFDLRSYASSCYCAIALVHASKAVNAHLHWLGAFELGNDNVAIYDGSWSEWDMDTLPTPVVKS